MGSPARKSDALAHSRWMRHASGESPEEIADSDGVSVDTVMQSLKKGSDIENTRVTLRIMEMRGRRAIETEELRQQMQQEFAEKYKKALSHLLEGKAVVIERLADGTVNIKEYVDPKVLVAGMDQFRKSVSMDEKPAVPTTVVNVNQQNNTQTNTLVDKKYDFETMLETIRAKQKAADPGKFIEGEIAEVTDNEAVNIPPVPPTKLDDEALNF